MIEHQPKDMTTRLVIWSAIASGSIVALIAILLHTMTGALKPPSRPAIPVQETAAVSIEQESESSGHVTDELQDSFITVYHISIMSGHYHIRACPLVNNSQGVVTSGTLYEARRAGYIPCEDCKPPGRARFAEELARQNRLVSQQVYSEFKESGFKPKSIEQQRREQVKTITYPPTSTSATGVVGISSAARPWTSSAGIGMPATGATRPSNGIGATTASTVYFAPHSGNKYHRSSGCRGLKNALNTKPITLTQARNMGLTACSFCGGG